MSNVSNYQIITDRVIELLERGVVPWRRSWSGGAAGLPRNLSSGRAYRGVNSFLLACSDYESPYWLTFKQAKDRGGHVRRGEKGWPVIFWKWLDVADRNSADGMKRIPMLKRFTAFNVQQCDGIDAPALNVRTFDHEPIAAAQRIVDAMPNPPRIENRGGQPSYSPMTDTVAIPARERFETAEAYYATLFHELTHSTGHASRLGRFDGPAAQVLDSDRYGREELVAEMGAAFLCGMSGISAPTIDQTAAYIGGWLKRIRQDARLIVNAAAAAQKAADYIAPPGTVDAANGTDDDADDAPGTDADGPDIAYENDHSRNQSEAA